MAPARHVKPSSTVPSQSSSTPLHVSDGFVQLSQLHEPLQTRDPIDPHDVRQLPVDPWQHAKPSSQAVLQSSSMPLQVSSGGEQRPHEQTDVQTRDPVVPQLVVHEPVEPLQHTKLSSQLPSQSSSVPLQSSGAPGNTVSSASLQSSAGTPPLTAHTESPCPSPSLSRVVFEHIPGTAPVHRSSVQELVSLHVGEEPGKQPIVALQASAPLQKLPSSQNIESGAKTQPPAASTQLSTVHRIPSSHVSGIPGAQRLRKHVSTPLHGLPSSHSASVPPGQVAQSGSIPSQS
jgi:hypothetical protein